MVINHKKLNTDVSNNNNRHFMSAQFGLVTGITQCLFTFNFLLTDQQQGKVLPEITEKL